MMETGALQIAHQLGNTPGEKTSRPRQRHSGNKYMLLMRGFKSKASRNEISSWTLWKIYELKYIYEF